MKKKCSYCSIEVATEPNGLCKECVERKKLIPIRKWLWRLTKQYLFEFRHYMKCSTCVKRDVCVFHQQMIQDIIVNGETRGVFEIHGILWWRCSFYLKGELPDRSLKVMRG